MENQEQEKNETTPSVEKKEEVKKEFDGKIFAEQIIERSKLKEFIEVNIIDAPTYKYEYLDWDGETINSLKGFEQYIQVGEFRVSCSVTQDQIQKLKDDWNIDVEAMVQNVLINETALSINKFMLANIGKIARENYLNDYTWGDTFKAWAYNYANKFRFKKNWAGDVKKPLEYKKKIKVTNIKDLLKEILK